MAYFNAFYYIQYLQSIGFVNIIVPFLLIFTVIFSLLEKTHIFGKESKTNVSALVAILLSLLAIVNTRLVEFLNVYLSNLTISIVFLTFTLLIFQSVLEIKSPTMKVFTVILGVFAVIWSLASSQFSPYGNNFDGFFNVIYINIAPIIDEVFVVATIVLIIWLVIRSATRGQRTHRTTQ